MSYEHIKDDQRTELAVLLRAGHNLSFCAKMLGKHKSTITRELHRNSSLDGIYRVWKAKKKTAQRRKKANQRFCRLRKNKKLKRYIARKLLKTWSPEQIAGKLRERYGRTVICHETIYQWIYRDRPEYRCLLRCKKGKYRRRYGTRKKEKIRDEAKKKRIDTRPKVIEERIRLGDWEGDTIRGKERKTAILTHVDRKSGYLIAKKLDRALAETTRKAIIKSFQKIPKKKCRTITYDNGLEFAEYDIVERETRAAVYFAYPYHSWERGTNENTNGLIREFFPKKSPFKDVTQEDLDKIVHLINHRPRKRLNYLTPHEVFNECCTLE